MIVSLAVLVALLAAPASPPMNGWSAPAAPNRRVLPLDLGRIDESKLLRPGHRAALYAIGANAADYHRDRLPIILVHGIRGTPAAFQDVPAHLARADRQLYVLAYDSWKRRTSETGSDFADELRTLQKSLGANRQVVILAHSMGGLVSRWALNELYIGPNKGIEKWKWVRLFTADSPWHGYGGPSDRGFEGFMMAVARPFLAAALQDMRAKSSMFQGDPKTKDPASKAGLLNVTLPENTEVDVVFAQEGSEIWDYTEKQLLPLAGKVAEYYKNETKITGQPWLENFWKALIQARTYFAFQDELRTLDDDGKLDEAAVKTALLKYYPRFPGDHMGVLREHKGQKSLLDYWSEMLK